MSRTPEYMAVNFDSGCAAGLPQPSLKEAYKAYCDEHGDPISDDDLTFYEVKEIEVVIEKEVKEVVKNVTSK